MSDALTGYPLTAVGATARRPALDHRRDRRRGRGPDDRRGVRRRPRSRRARGHGLAQGSVMTSAPAWPQRRSRWLATPLPRSKRGRRRGRLRSGALPRRGAAVPGADVGGGRRSRGDRHDQPRDRRSGPRPAAGAHRARGGAPAAGTDDLPRAGSAGRRRGRRARAGRRRGHRHRAGGRGHPGPVRRPAPPAGRALAGEPAGGTAARGPWLRRRGGRRTAASEDDPPGPPAVP